jgi:hypothetical protein
MPLAIRDVGIAVPEGGIVALPGFRGTTDLARQPTYQIVAIMYYSFDREM